MLPRCPPQLPYDLRDSVLAFASSWAASPLRPRVEPAVGRAWDALLQEWVHTATLPLYVRKDSARGGGAVTHHSERLLIPCDNSTAVWAFTLALEGTCPTLAEVAVAADNGEIPVGFTQLKRFSEFYAAGWKLAHVDSVGLKTRTPLEEIPLATLQDHLIRLLSPANLFAVPNVWAGLGEIPEVVEVIRAYDALARGDAPRASGAIPERGVATRAPGTPTFHANTYRATRLLFKASIIERLADDQPFRIDTPQGTYEMTKADFHRTFANVAASNTYQRTGVYSYKVTPEKALRFLV